MRDRRQQFEGQHEISDVSDVFGALSIWRAGRSGDKAMVSETLSENDSDLTPVIKTLVRRLCEHRDSKSPCAKELLVRHD